MTAAGSFTPTGGTGADGTTSSEAFAASAPSGKLQDPHSDRNCNSTPTPSSPNCSVQLQFTANRSNTTSDGAFMYDQSVVVKVVVDGGPNDGQVVATHSYGTGSINNLVQITSTAYQTTFKRGDLVLNGYTVTTPGTYKVKIYFTEVDGQPMLQATSSSANF